MTIKNLTPKLQSQLELISKTSQLFVSSISGQDIWEAYINSFTKDDNPVFRDPESSYKNCNLCKNFLRRYGNLIGINENYELVTLWDIENVEEYSNSFNKMSHLLKNAPIANAFFETYEDLKSLPYEKNSKTQEFFKLGVEKNFKMYTEDDAKKFGVVTAGEVREFNHLHIHVPKTFIDQSGQSKQAIMAQYRDAKEVFKRGMIEIPVDTLELVIDLILQGSLLNADAHLDKLEAFLLKKKAFDQKGTANVDHWCWMHSHGFPFAKFRNELIGVLCTELAEGKELNEACMAWNRRVDPANYMKAKSPITQQQIDEARKFVEEHGYIDSFDRKFAILDDIKADEIRFMNVGNGGIAGVSIFDKVKASSTRHKRAKFDHVEEIGIEKFMKKILPNTTGLELFLENRMEHNLVTITTSNHADSKPIFNWSNNYSWTYNGNLTGKSMIKQAVKDAGGNVEGVLNCRLAWNDGDGSDNSDLDIWAIEPNDTKIGYSTGFRKDQNNKRTPMSGQLDVDNTNPNGKLAVENITWTRLSSMKSGVYKIWVNQYAARNSQGFKIEIEFDGEIHEYSYNQAVNGNVHVAEITLKNGQFSIKHLLPSNSSSKELYGLTTQEFQQVELVCLSPNHWGENKQGNKHFLFMLKDCKTDKKTRSFHNENLIPELRKHRKVMEVLATQSMLEPPPKQLCGVGFNATVRDHLFVKVKGTHQRVLKIKF